MRLTLGQLRLEIRRLMEFGVDTQNRNMAGFFMAGGISNQHRDRENTLMDPPPGLGDEQEREDKDEYEEQEKGQPAVRSLDRRGETGSAGVRGAR